LKDDSYLLKKRLRIAQESGIADSRFKFGGIESLIPNVSEVYTLSSWESVW
jgi:hypothetical protein